MAQKFHSGNVHNYDSLYTSFRDVSGILDDISNDQLKEKVKDYITKTKSKHFIVFFKYNYTYNYRVRWW